MKIAVISDVHANILGLEAALEDIQKQGISRVYCAGDLVGYAPFPNEVIELIRKHQILTVMGNYDDAVGNMRLICGCDYKNEQEQALGEKSIRWTKEHTTEQNLEFLRALPTEIRLESGDQKVLIVHGSPRMLTEYLTESTADEYLLELVEEAKTDVLVCGHTHIPLHKVIQGKHVINAGSVGKPKHGIPEATYVIISFGDEVKVEVRKISYDYETVAKAIEESELPNEFAEKIRRGQG